ncbi:MAG: formylglycine-generating enzyme family protein [Polyangiales bacterium]
MRGAALVLVGLVGSGLCWKAAAERVVSLSVMIAAAPRVPAGWLEMGSDAADVAFAVASCAASASGEEASLCRPELFADEQPRHRVYIGAFRIDRTEVSQRDYRRCVEHGACPPARVSDLDARLGQLDQPVVGVTVAEASRYCAWAGGRLPTEAEWERAARADDSRRFPWGRYWNDRIANHGAGADRPSVKDGYEFAAPVTALADGKSAFGVLNLAGNVWELTADRYAPDAYAKSERIDPRGPSAGDQQVIRGGSWRSPPYTLRVTQRAAIKRDDSRPDVGFRCAYNVP